ncbi:hypothetical protein [Coleofasciculus sp. FACHB-SPT9]|uniref:hypothetical protein n=1 Tax=Cyanophyceae TaxID=3028117 RepID=UPI00168720B1|nr:hypothetical protein [Coleofasciculus sp. FACHB-SPT9]MBD1892452.1 hypothetical protein [Coleofasciculus sp. FACHB-SPT9]
MSSQSQRSLNWLLQQFQLKSGKPDIAASLQTLVLVLVPIGVGVLMGHPAASAIAVIGAWSVALVNVEGAYRQQATAKIAAAISITAMLFLANLDDGTLWLSALTMFLVIFIAGFVSLFGQAVSSISLTTSIVFIVALPQQHRHCKPFENALPFPQNWIELPKKSPVFIVRSLGCKHESTNLNPNCLS